MKTFSLSDGTRIPAIGFGTYKVDSHAVSLAIEAGYRYFDTAPIYGTEGMVGEAIESSGLARSDFFIATKLWKTDMGYENTLAAFGRSLEALRTDYLDVFMIHWPKPEPDYESWRELDLETWHALEELHHRGAIRELGLSNFLPYHAENIIGNCSVMPSVAQLEFHPGYTQAFALNYYREHGIQVQAWSPTARGRVFEDVLIRELCAKYHVNPVQLCLAFCVSEGVMPLPKSSSLERMRQNLESVNIELEPEDISRLENMPPLGWGGEHPDRERVRL